MNTRGFDSFILEISATGREKHDGYTLVFFDQMSVAENEKAFLLLKDELPVFYGAVDALVYIEKQKALPIIESYLSGFDSDQQKKAFGLYAILYKENPKTEYAEKIVSGWDIKAPTSRLALISHIKSLTTHPVFIELLKKALFTEVDENIHSLVAACLLDKYGITREDPSLKSERMVLKRMLVSKDVENKKNGLDALSSKYKIC